MRRQRRRPINRGLRAGHAAEARRGRRDHHRRPQAAADAPLALGRVFASHRLKGERRVEVDVLRRDIVSRLARPEGANDADVALRDVRRHVRAPCLAERRRRADELAEHVERDAVVDLPRQLDRRHEERVAAGCEEEGLDPRERAVQAWQVPRARAAPPEATVELGREGRLPASLGEAERDAERAEQAQAACELEHLVYRLLRAAVPLRGRRRPGSAGRPASSRAARES
eukprot:6357791-Prymnesium_polylepis.1